MDPIADFLIRIKNASLAGHKKISLPHSKEKENLAKILQKEGFLETVEVAVDEAKHQNLVLSLPTVEGSLRVIEVKRISKPGRRVYAKARTIKLSRRGPAITILSTIQGLMTDREAIKKNLGGEVICKIV